MADESQRWTEEDMPRLEGRTVVVTGANSGIGKEAARAMADAGAHVIFACRSMERGRDALDDVREQIGRDVSLELMRLDLADLDSIHHFAGGLAAVCDRVDILCNNAGLMAIPRRETADGFEMQLGVNHMGHFALTGLVLDLLRASDDARVVTVSSGAHKAGNIRFEDLHWRDGYSKWGAYCQSKLANLLFAFELQRRLERAGLEHVRSVACHPGYAATELQTKGPRMSGSKLMESFQSLSNRYIAQSARMGALPTLRAATDPGVGGSAYIGPDGLLEATGYPRRVQATRRARDPELAARLWMVSEGATGVRYDL
jgi:NAD(P)-dependent dehydrogenase (short-subunit alcohol dehydrogenase family)